MPIVFVHGVATREEGFERSWPDIEAYLRHYAAPALGPDTGQIAILPAFWGDVASAFRFGGKSRPRTPLFGMGSETSEQPSVLSAAEFVNLLPAEQPQPRGGPAAAGRGLITAGPPAAQPTASVSGLRQLTQEQLSDLMALSAQGPSGQAPPAEWLVTADEVAHDPEEWRQFQEAPDDATALSLFLEAVETRAGPVPGRLTGMGARERWAEWRRRITEMLDRGSHAPGFAVSRVLGEARAPVNDTAIRFFGDVFAYLDRRCENGGIGGIPRVVLDTLRTASQRRLSPEEPLVVITHSMGGQIVYDLVTHFLPAASGNGEQVPRIDFWCATASQVGLFLDLNLFLAKDAGKAPLARPPSRWLGSWWNVWDYNDFLSYSARDIVEGVDDEAYSSGLSLVSAHSGYLQRPSFYRRLRRKLDDARKRNWDRDVTDDTQ